MLYDIVLSYDGKAQNLYYAPFREGPRKGELFFVEDDDLKVHKAEQVYSGVDKGSPLWDILQQLCDSDIWKIRSVINENPMYYYEDHEEENF